MSNYTNINITIERDGDQMEYIAKFTTKNDLPPGFVCESIFNRLTDTMKPYIETHEGNTESVITKLYRNKDIYK